MTKPTPVENRVPRDAIEKHPRGRRREKATDPSAKFRAKSPLDQSLEEKAPIHHVKSLGDIKI